MSAPKPNNWIGHHDPIGLTMNPAGARGRPYSFTNTTRDGTASSSSMMMARPGRQVAKPDDWLGSPKPKAKNKVSQPSSSSDARVNVASPAMANPKEEEMPLSKDSVAENSNESTKDQNHKNSMEDHPEQEIMAPEKDVTAKEEHDAVATTIISGDPHPTLATMTKVSVGATYGKPDGWIGHHDPIKLTMNAARASAKPFQPSPKVSTQEGTVRTARPDDWLGAPTAKVKPRQFGRVVTERSNSSEAAASEKPPEEVSPVKKEWSFRNQKDQLLRESVPTEPPPAAHVKSSKDEKQPDDAAAEQSVPASEKEHDNCEYKQTNATVEHECHVGIERKDAIKNSHAPANQEGPFRTHKETKSEAHRKKSVADTSTLPNVAERTQANEEVELAAIVTTDKANRIDKPCDEDVARASHDHVRMHHGDKQAKVTKTNAIAEEHNPSILVGVENDSGPEDKPAEANKVDVKVAAKAVSSSSPISTRVSVVASYTKPDVWIGHHDPIKLTMNAASANAKPFQPIPKTDLNKDTVRTARPDDWLGASPKAKPRKFGKAAEKSMNSEVASVKPLETTAKKKEWAFRKQNVKNQVRFESVPQVAEPSNDAKQDGVDRIAPTDKVENPLSEEKATDGAIETEDENRGDSSMESVTDKQSEEHTEGIKTGIYSDQFATTNTKSNERKQGISTSGPASSKPTKISISSSYEKPEVWVGHHDPTKLMMSAARANAKPFHPPKTDNTLKHLHEVHPDCPDDSLCATKAKYRNFSLGAGTTHAEPSDGENFPVAPKDTPNSAEKLEDQELVADDLLQKEGSFRAHDEVLVEVLSGDADTNRGDVEVDVLKPKMVPTGQPLPTLNKASSASSYGKPDVWIGHHDPIKLSMNSSGINSKPFQPQPKEKFSRNTSGARPNRPDDWLGAPKAKTRSFDRTFNTTTTAEVDGNGHDDDKSAGGEGKYVGTSSKSLNSSDACAHDTDTTTHDTAKAAKIDDDEESLAPPDLDSSIKDLLLNEGSKDDDSEKHENNASLSSMDLSTSKFQHVNNASFSSSSYRPGEWLGGSHPRLSMSDAGAAALGKPTGRDKIRLHSSLRDFEGRPGRPDEWVGFGGGRKSRLAQNRIEGKASRIKDSPFFRKDPVH